jgi:hypothetical protein
MTAPRAAMIYQHATNTADQLIADGLSLLIEQHHKGGRLGHAEGTNDEETNVSGVDSSPHSIDELGFRNGAGDGNRTRV